MDETRWPAFRHWMVENLERFDEVFRERVRRLDVDNYEGPPAGDL